MTTYGFKLVKVQLYCGQGQKAQDFGQSKYLDKVLRDVEDAMERRRAALESAAVASTADGAPITLDAITGEATVISSGDVVDEEGPGTLRKTRRRQSVVRFEAATRLNSALLLQVQYGIVGDHEMAVDPEEKKKDADLKSLATTRSYRVLLMAPREGASAFMAVEVIGRSHAGVEIPRRLYQAASGHEYKLRAKGVVADEPAVRELLKNGAVEEVQLIKTFIPSDSSVPSPAESVTMTFKVGTATSVGSRVLERMASWNFFTAKKDAGEGEGNSVSGTTGLDGVSPTDDLNPETEANALAAILWRDASGLGFDNAKVKVASKKQNKTLQPLDFREGFIYDLGEERVSDEKFLEEVHHAAWSLFSNFEMDMESDWYLSEPRVEV